MSKDLSADDGNRLLAALSPGDLALVAPHLRSMPVDLHQSLIATGASVTDLYFPNSGLVSITADSPTGRVEIGLIGREGVVGATPALLGDDRSPHTHFVQLPGHLLAIAADALVAASERSASLRRMLLRFVQVQFVQTAQTAFANAHYNTNVRLARWLLMCHDRIDGDEIIVTHEFISSMLGVQRVGVTVAVRVLQGMKLIEGLRGRVIVLDRAGLVAMAASSYGTPEAEYARLIGAGLTKPSPAVMRADAAE